MLQVTDSIALDERELEEHFIHASGPGGQNVNKVATAVQIRFNVAHTRSLPETVRRRLRTMARGRINSRGWLVIEARRYRSQERNRADARYRLARLVRRASVAPKPRVPTSPTPGSQRRRVESKRRRGIQKQLRSRPADLEQ